MSDNRSPEHTKILVIEIVIALMVVGTYIGVFTSAINSFKKTDDVKPTVSTEQTTEEIIVDKDEYVVKFMYNDSVFATQIVHKGGKASKPTFTPSPNGSWDYNFDKEVNQDIEIMWR